MDNLRSATCALEETVPQGKTLAQAAELTRAKAAERLGGKDGLALIGFHERGDGAVVGVTWRREWNEPAEGAAAPAAKASKTRSKSTSSRRKK